uniref:DDE-1 domain-containing protein n=1 Tax=Strongyloides papillosus TaxID=174720 RepID=A0A0N5BCD5_STREA
MSGYPTFKIVNDYEGLEKIESLSKKLHCAMKFAGSQLVTVSMFKKWLFIYQEQLNLKDGEIESIIEENTPYGWSGITNYMVNHLLFIPFGEPHEYNDVLYYEKFVVLKKVTIYDYKFDDSCCTAAFDKWEAKEIIRMGVDAYNMIKRPEILEIQKRYYNVPENRVLDGDYEDFMYYGDDLTEGDVAIIPQEINDRPFQSDDTNTSSRLSEDIGVIEFDEFIHDEPTLQSYENNNNGEVDTCSRDPEDTTYLNCCDENAFIQKFFSISPCNFPEALLTLNYMHNELGLEEKDEVTEEDFTEGDMVNYLSVYYRLISLQQRYFKLTTKVVMSPE